MSNNRTMNADDMTLTSNEWMRRFVEEPEKFSREFEMVSKFLTEEAAGEEPSYGSICTAYQFQLLDELSSTAA